PPLSGVRQGPTAGPSALFNEDGQRHFASRDTFLCDWSVDLARGTQRREAGPGSSGGKGVEGAEYTWKLHIFSRHRREQLIVCRLDSMGALCQRQRHTDLDGPIGFPTHLAVVDDDQAADRASSVLGQGEEPVGALPD